MKFGDANVILESMDCIYDSGKHQPFEEVLLSLEAITFLVKFLSEQENTMYAEYIKIYYRRQVALVLLFKS